MIPMTHAKVPGNEKKPALFTLAEKMHDTYDGFAGYDYAKCVWLGSPDRGKRLAGEHPWPTRIHEGKEYAYSIPVLSAVSTQTETVLYVGKDSWKSSNDPNAWLVAERHLFTGRELDHHVLTASVDAARQLWLQLAPSNEMILPPILRDSLYRQPSKDQIRLEGQLDDRFYLSYASIREGVGSRVVEYEDYEALEAMLTMVRMIREAQAQHERQHLEKEAWEFALGHRSVIYAGLHLVL